ncbi:hypothetical protein OJ998_33885 [Solirubrobacter taibaiensis]|nr:hypothetical protein [Solirubrobacter taibaiensis]
MRKRLLILPLALLAGTASVATAQVVNNDHDRGPVAGQLIDHPCGPEQQSVVRTQSAVGSTNSTAPDPLGAATMTVNVPDGQTRCIRVLFTAETSCTGFAGAPNDYCRIQATIDGAPMDPNGAGFMTIDSEDASGDGHAFEWIKRVGDGPHVIELVRTVGNAATTFTHDDWTLDVALKL